MTAGMDTEVLIIPANVIAVLKEQNLHVRCFLYELATKRFSDVMWAMQQIMFKGLDRRLADFLLAEAERTGSDTIRMTHEQIAQHISSAREAVARMLKSFSEDGLVELKRGAITLRDTGGTALPPAPPRREDRCGSRRKEQTAFRDIRCRCCVRTRPFHNDGQKHFGVAFLAPVWSRMTRMGAVSVFVPYQWQLCLPQPWSPQV